MYYKPSCVFLCVCQVSTYFELSFIGCQQRMCFLSPSSSITSFIFLLQSPSARSLSLSLSISVTPFSPNDEHFLFSPPFIRLGWESVGKSGYKLDTRR